MTSIEILIPKGFGGKDGQQALQEIRNGQHMPKPAQVSQKQEYLYEPKYNLEFEKRLSCTGASWDKTHEFLQVKGWKMPTLLEFMTLIKHLLDNPSPEGEEFLEKTTKAGPYLGVWLDTRFNLHGRKDIVYTHHKIKNNRKNPIVPKYRNTYIDSIGERLRKRFSHNEVTSLIGFDRNHGLPERLPPTYSPSWPLIVDALQPVSMNGATMLYRDERGIHLYLDFIRSPGSVDVGTYACRRKQYE